MPPQDLWLPPHTCLSRPGPDSNHSTSTNFSFMARVATNSPLTCQLYSQNAATPPALSDPIEVHCIPLQGRGTRRQSLCLIVRRFRAEAAATWWIMMVDRIRDVIVMVDPVPCRLLIVVVDHDQGNSSSQSNLSRQMFVHIESSSTGFF
ncbi:unnamed protein product [Pleuronectes platessa]|uniref:Uncharacterized protein n=1 Tax=Pleuronectes platessa TaxID=8262 RepID=A0A9N7U097_PLEPL|nr:unnamed protein product [Pleuronectes platessa]